MTSSVQLLVSPWRSYQELQDFYDTLFKDQESESFDGYVERLIKTKNTLISWHLRLGGQPQYSKEIQATCAFVSAIIHDRLMDAMTTGFKGTDHGSYEAAIHLEGALPSLYSSAVIAFYEMVYYNSVHSGEKVDRRQISREMGNVLESLGLPNWICQVRHEAAHFEKPSLVLLRRTSSIGLDYLRDKFWKPLLTDKRLDVKAEKLVSSVSKDKPEVIEDIRELLLDDLEKQTFVNFLVKSLLKSSRFDQNATIYGVYKLETKTKDRGSTVIEIVSKADLLPDLCHHLIGYFESDNFQLKTSSIAWFDEIMRGLTSTEELMSDFLYPHLNSIDNQVHLQIVWTRVFDHLTRKPSRTSLYLLKYFTTILSSSKDIVYKAINGMSILLGEDDKTQVDNLKKQRKRKGKSVQLDSNKKSKV